MFWRLMNNKFEETNFSWVNNGVGWIQMGSQWIYDNQWQFLAEPEEWSFHVYGYQDWTIEDFRFFIEDLKFSIAIDAETAEVVYVVPVLDRISLTAQPKLLEIHGRWELSNE